MEFNKLQSNIHKDLKKELGKEFFAELIEVLDAIPFVANMISPTRRHLKQMPKDKLDRVIVDLENSHILSNMDFFREAAITFSATGRYTNLLPNTHPGSEYIKFWKEEGRRCREGLVRSDGEWVTGLNYFYWNYSPILLVGEDDTGLSVRIEGFPKPWDGDYLYFHYIERCRREGKHANILKARGRGFQQPNSEPVLTPDGFAPMGELKVGDKVIGRNGKSTNIIDIIPQGKDDVYEVELHDGRKIKCGYEHLWGVYNTKRNYTIVTTEYLFNNRLKQNEGTSKSSYSYRLPAISPVNFSTKKTDIDPYLLGLLIGDGGMTGSQVRFSTADKELLTYITIIIGKDYWVKKMPGDDYGHVIVSKDRSYNKFMRAIKVMGLNVKSYKKFIPEEYKYGSIEQRFEIIKGLMDTDGTVSDNGNARFTSSSEKLIDDVAWVLRSLGIRCNKAKTNLGGKIMDFGNGHKSIVRDSWVLSITTYTQIFKLKRKALKLEAAILRRKFKNQDRIGIKAIKKLDYKEESTCIYIQNEDHLYLTTEFVPTHNSYKGGSLLAKHFKLGDRHTPKSSRKNQKSFAVANEKEFLTKDGVLNKFVDNVTFLDKFTPWPRSKLKASLNDMHWRLGYINNKTKDEDGVLNEVIGVTLKNDPQRARGKRGNIIWEEMGKFPGLLTAWQIARPSVESGNKAFALMVAWGTGGTDEANFEAAEEMFYNPDGYNILGLRNVFDRGAGGNAICAFFAPEYMNREDCYDRDGNSDIIKALIEVMYARKKVKYGSSDPNALTQAKAEAPITPQEAVLRKGGTIFPVSDLKDYLADISVNEAQFIAPHYIGRLSISGDNDVNFKLDTNITPVREFPIKDNLNKEGALELFQLPIKNADGEVPRYRYIGGVDTYDDDHSTTNSLGSVFIMDRITDSIVAEYTGRPKTANEFYEIVYRLAKFYNAIVNYENDKKGLFAYFSNRRGMQFLCETPEILKSMDMIKAPALYGNKSVGTNSGVQINAWGRRLQADWLLAPAYGNLLDEEDTEEEEVIIKQNMHTVRSIGYLKELIYWNPDGNFDRVSAMGMLMILREDMMKRDVTEFKQRVKTVLDDPFFSRQERRQLSL